MKPPIRLVWKLATTASRFRPIGLAMALAAAMAMPFPSHADPDGAWDAERAVAGMERLRAEIRVLTELAAAQAGLLAWNRVRAETGAGPAVLPASLCAEAALAPWCRMLPATFGPAAAGEREADPNDPAGMAEAPARDGQREDGDR